MPVLMFLLVLAIPTAAVVGSQVNTTPQIEQHMENK